MRMGPNGIAVLYDWDAVSSIVRHLYWGQPQHIFR
jgi:hypothetical protein